jgi:hypothetical protein
MRFLAMLLVVALAVGCSLGSDHDDPAEPGSLESVLSGELSCEPVALISIAPEPTNEGYDTPEQAAESYTDWVSDLPDGTWQHLEGESWILVRQDGRVVARADVGVITENAVTTFNEDRFWSGHIEYCP